MKLTEMKRGLNLYGRGFVMVMSPLTRCDISYEADIYTRDGTKVMPPNPFSETITIIVIKFTFNLGTSFTRLCLFFYQVFFIIDTLFRPLLETLYTGPVKLFPEAPELLTHAEFHLVVIRKMASSECIIHRAKMEVSGS
jgi:hypothetical protein